ncbi:MAG: hypothetical protein U0R70_13420 [Solirubrobacteraceae bacterium]
MTPRVLYDEGAASWRDLGIQYQPAWILFGANGKAIEVSPDAFDAAAVLAAARIRP